LPAPPRSLIYRTYSLDAKNQQIARAPILVHGQGRDAEDSWRSGGAATKNPKLTSYDFAGAILRKLARKEIFPNLKVIVVAGHSAARPGIWRVRESEVRCPPPRRCGSALRPQCPLYVHGRAGAAHSLPQTVTISGSRLVFRVIAVTIAVGHRIG
jgi:hypothetical protein